LHGGVTAAIIDDVLGATMFSLNQPTFFTTINNVIDYFSTAKEGENIIAETKIIKQGRQFINAQCEIWNKDKTKLIARGYSNLFKTEVSR
jgi:acyl-coenzyme A thioesterase 13